MADRDTVFTTACFRNQLSDDELARLSGLVEVQGLSKEQCADLNYFIGDVQSDLIIANDLVDLADTVVGNLNVSDDRRDQAQACSALLGVQLQLQAITRRLGAISDKLRVAS